MATRKFEGYDEMHAAAEPCVQLTRDYITAVALGTRDAALAVVRVHPERRRERADGGVVRNFFGEGANTHVPSWGAIFGVLIGLAVEDYRPGSRLNFRRPVVATTILTSLVPHRDFAGETGRMYAGTLSTNGFAESQLVGATTASAVKAGENRRRYTDDPKEIVADYARGYVSQVASALVIAATINGAARANLRVRERVEYPEGVGDVLGAWGRFSSPQVIEQHLASLTIADRLRSHDFPVELRMAAVPGS